MIQNAKTVAKLAMIDPEDNYLMMWRSDHPAFGEDPDLPGGTLEEGETALETMLREVEEEAGVVIDRAVAQEIYNGTDYSGHGTRYVLYIAKLASRPQIIMSWEHSAYKWLPRNEFISVANGAKDSYMHMVGERIALSNP